MVCIQIKESASGIHRNQGTNLGHPHASGAYSSQTPLMWRHIMCAPRPCVPRPYAPITEFCSQTCMSQWVRSWHTLAQVNAYMDMIRDIHNHLHRNVDDTEGTRQLVNADINLNGVATIDCTQRGRMSTARHQQLNISSDHSTRRSYCGGGMSMEQ